VSGTVVAIGQVIQLPIALAMIWVSAATLAVGRALPAVATHGFGVAYIGEQCSRTARGMLGATEPGERP
jgi:hypothetical protein